MRHRLVLFSLLLAVTAASPQALAAERGSIVGTVINAATNRPQAGVEVRLTGGDGSGERVEHSMTTDKTGRYRFHDLPTGSDLFYAIDAIFDGGVFAGRAISLPDDTAKAPVVRSTLKVWPTTTDPTAIVIRRDDLILVLDDDKVGVIESVTVVNRSRDAYIGRAGVPGGPSLGFALPGSADAGGVAIVRSDLDIPAIVGTDFGFAATVAIPPGERLVMFSYEVPAVAGTFDLSRAALYPILSMSVFASEPIVVGGNRIESTDTATIGPDTYDAYEVEETIEAGDPIQLVATTDAGMPAGLVAGGVGAVVLGIVLWLLALRRGFKRRRPAARPADREELVQEIAHLDLRHRSGELDEQTYRRRRAELKSRIPT